MVLGKREREGECSTVQYNVVSMDDDDEGNLDGATCDYKRACVCLCTRPTITRQWRVLLDRDQIGGQQRQSRVCSEAVN